MGPLEANVANQGFLQDHSSDPVQGKQEADLVWGQDEKGDLKLLYHRRSSFQFNEGNFVSGFAIHGKERPKPFPVVFLLLAKLGTLISLQ